MSTVNGTYVNGDVSRQLQVRLNEPQTAQAINQILDKIELIAFAVTAVDGLLQRSNIIAEEAARGVADLKKSPPSDLTTLLQYLPQLIEMLPQMMAFLPSLMTLVGSAEFQRLLAVLSDPKALEAITSIVQNIDKIAFSIEAIDGFLQRSDAIIENVAGGIKDASGAVDTANLVALLRTLPQFMEAAPQLIEVTNQLVPVIASEPVQNFINSGALDRLVESGILSSQTVGVVGYAGQSLVHSYDTTKTRDTQIGLMGLFKASRDPDVQKALGFLVEFGKQFGREI